MIEFHDVTVCYNPQARHPVNAVSGIDLQIKPSEWVFLVGPSGAGKSTLLKLLHCGVQATSGAVRVDGQDITHLPPRQVPLLRRKIGVVFQDFQLLAQKTAWENVAFALQVIGTPQAQLARDVPQALDTVGLSHKAHAQPHELSGGEQQRVAIARAIVNNPTILLADEPTGNLDPRTAWDIGQVLQRINEERGTTVVMCTHDRNLVDALKRRVVRLVEGHIASDEANGIYHPEDNEPFVRQDYNAVPGTVEALHHEEDGGGDDWVTHTTNQPRSFADAPERPQPEPHVQEKLQNQAPLGSSENPIIRYGNRDR